MSKTYELAKLFKRKYPLTVAWRIRSHSKVIDKHLNPGEEVLYVFMGQKNHSSFDFVNTNLVVLTSKRLIIATKRLIFGYFFTAITPDMFNDLAIIDGIIWGRVKIDTIKEEEEKVTKIVKDVMENVIKLDVPLKVGIAKGKDLYEAK